MTSGASLKSRLRQLLVQTPLRHAAGPIFEGLVAAELFVLESLDARTRAERCDLRRVTAIVKTFERPRQLQRLLRSVRARWPELRVIVADDSRRPVSVAGVRTVKLPFDSGVAAGRQAALDIVDTELTWVLDDDFVLGSASNPTAAVELLTRHATLDLLGGDVVDLPFGFQRGSPTDRVYPTQASPVTALGTRFGGAIVCDKVPNFFVARTERLRLVGWDERLRRLEHGDFFTRARGVLTSAFLPSFWCFHAQSPFDAHYMQYRDAIADDEALLRVRYGLG